MWRKVNGWVIDRPQETAEAARLARRAVELGSDDAIALGAAGFVLFYVVGELDTGLMFIDRALALNPNLVEAWFQSGFARAWHGEPEQAIEHMRRAMRLSPLDKRMYAMHNGLAHAHFVAGHYDDASAWSEKAIREHPNYAGAMRVFTASNALAGRMEQAQKAMARLRQLDPALRISNLKDVLPLRRAEDFARWAEGLRLAGLPE